MVHIDQFAALGDPVRLRIVELLVERPRAVHELAGAFAISRPAVSRHLRVLKDADLVKETKAGRENLYALEAERLKVAGTWLMGLWSERLLALRSHAMKPAGQMEFDL